MSDLELRVTLVLMWVLGCGVIAVLYLTNKRMNQWKKAAEEWRALVQQYSNAAFSERMARIQLEQWLTAQGMTVEHAPEQKTSIH